MNNLIGEVAELQGAYWLSRHPSQRVGERYFSIDVTKRAQELERQLDEGLKISSVDVGFSGVEIENAREVTTRLEA